MTDSGPRFPVGTFVAEAGSWVLTFTDEGEFSFLESGRVDAVGTFSIKANELTWETDSYCDRADAGKATYLDTRRRHFVVSSQRRRQVR